MYIGVHRDITTSTMENASFGPSAVFALSGKAFSRSTVVVQNNCTALVKDSGLGFKVQGLRFRVLGSGFRVQGLGRVFYIQVFQGGWGREYMRFSFWIARVSRENFKNTNAILEQNFSI